MSETTVTKLHTRRRKQKRRRRQECKRRQREVQDTMQDLLHTLERMEEREALLTQNQRICGEAWNNGDCYRRTFCHIDHGDCVVHPDHRCQTCGYLLCGCCMFHGMIIVCANENWWHIPGCPVCKYKCGEYLNMNIM
jgi:hypothetical protein